MNRGIIYYMWGNNPKQEKLLKKSIKSAEKFGYNYRVIRDNTKDYEGFRKRIGLFDKSPFKTTLYLDADTQIMSNIDYGFEMAEKYGLACTIAPAVSAYEALKYHKNSLLNIIPKDLPQYNCGVLFFSQKSQHCFNLWSYFLKKYTESSENDQPYFSYAVYCTMNPYILPKNWNYRPHLRYTGELFGEVKILHSN